MSNLSRIPAEILKYNLLPRLTERQANEFVAVSPTVAEKSKGYLEDLAYWKKRVEFEYNKKIPIKPKYGEYKINWRNLYVLLEGRRIELEKLIYDVPEIVNDSGSNDEEEYIRENIWYALLKPNEDDVNYIIMAKDFEIPLNDKDNIAIIHAARKGHTNILNFLIDDPEVDPSDQNNKALWFSAYFGYLDIFNILINDERVISRGIDGKIKISDRGIVDDNEIYVDETITLLESAVIGENLDIVNGVLSMTNYLENNSGNAGLSIINSENVEVTERLLEEPIIVQSIEENIFDVLHDIGSNGYLDTLKLLIDKLSSNNFDIDNFAFHESGILDAAIRNRHVDVIDYLLDDRKMEVNAETIMKAIPTEKVGGQNRLNIMRGGKIKKNWDDKDRELIKKLMKHSSDNDEFIGRLFKMPSRLYEFIKGYYEVEVDKYDYNDRKLPLLYNLLEETNKIIDKYIITKDYTEARNKLGKLLKESFDKYMFTAYKYIIEKGGPITYDDGITLSNSMLRYGLKAIDFISSERLNYFMKNSEAAEYLITAITRSLSYAKTQEQGIKMLDYLFDNYNTQHLYKLLNKSYQTIPLLKQYIDNRLNM